MSLEHQSDGTVSGRGGQRPPAGGPAWPVLAKLPRVGAPQAAPRQPSPAARLQDNDAAPLRIAGAETEISTRRQRYVVDPPHRTQAPINEAARADVETSAPLPTQSPQAVGATRHYRIDHAASHRPARHANSPQREVATLSGSIFRLHDALAPHMGLIGAAALLLCGGVMYWLALGRPGAVLSPNNVLHLQNGLSRDAAPVPDDENQSATSNPSLGAPPIDWAAPHVATKTVASGESEQQTPSPAEPRPTAGEGPTLSPAESPAKSQEPIITTSVYEPITPTPQAEAYPTTPYPAFSFAEQAPSNVGSPAAAVAERPSSSQVPNTTR